MGTRSIVVSEGVESRRLDTAFYKFVELRGRSALDRKNNCILQTFAEREQRRKVVTLWSEAAASDFVEFWERFNMVHPVENAPVS